MLKRSIAVIRQWLSPQQQPGSRDGEAVAARRGFFRKAAVGAVSVTTTAGLAKLAADSVDRPDLKELYAKESTAGERELLSREYVVMTDQEKEEMVRQFVDDYAAERA